MSGPFNPDITPVKATYHFISRTGKWHVKASRQIVIAPDGAKREYVQQEFSDYEAALTFVSIFFGNA